MVHVLAGSGRWLLIVSAALLLASAGLRLALSRGDKAADEGEAALVPVSGVPMAPSRAVRIGHRLHLVAWWLISGALLLLAWLFVSDAFAFVYVADRSNIGMPLVYKITAIWAGQEGSLLFWLWIQAGYGLVVSRLALRRRALDSGAALGLALISAFFAVLVAMVADPFVVRLPAPADGAGMNPILQSYWMTAHPVMLYLGYIGLSVPFAYGAASLFTGDEAWIRRTRRWALVAWTFLSMGIIFGARWAYEELGWGGYWGWDPVENASFMPWLIATAFVHSGIIQEKRGMLKRWNHALILITYALTIFGTLITRSGILSSVHAFVESDITPWFIVFLGFVTATYLYGLTRRWPDLVDQRPIESPLSREASFLANNVVLVATCFAIFWGTVFPLVASALGRQVTVGTPYFDRVTGPLFLALVVLMGVGPMLGWRRATKSSLQRHFTGPALNALFMLVFLVTIGIREMVTLMVLPASVFVLTTIVMEFAKGVSVRSKSRGEPVWLALPRLMNRSPGRYGGYIVHAGILLIVVGVAASTVYQRQENVVLAVGEQAVVGPYTVRLFDIREIEQGGVPAVEADLLVSRDGKALGYIKPSKRFYPTAIEMGPTTETAVYGNLQGDLYAVLAGWEPFGSFVGFKLYYNPLVWLIWAGGIFTVLGGAFAFWPRKAQARAETEHALASLAELEYDYQMGKVGKAEYDAVYSEIAPGALEQLRRERDVSQRVIDELEERLEGGAGSRREHRPSVSPLVVWAVIAGAGILIGLLAPTNVSAQSGEAPMGVAVAIPNETIVLKFAQGRLLLLNLVTVTNISDATVDEVRLPIVAGAVGLETQTLRLVEGADVVVDDQPLRPGETRRYSLQYEIPAVRWPFGLVREVLHPTERLALLTSPEELRVFGIGFGQSGFEEFAGETLLVTNSAWIAPGTVWQAILRPADGALAIGWDPALQHLPTLATPDQIPGSGIVRALGRLPAVVWIGFLVLVGVAAFGQWRKGRTDRPRTQAPEAGAHDALSEIEGIVRAIARLELAFAEGAVGEGVYRKRRARMMDRLVQRTKEEGVAASELRSLVLEED